MIPEPDNSGLLLGAATLLLGFALGWFALGLFPKRRVKQRKTSLLDHLGTKAGW